MNPALCETERTCMLGGIFMTHRKWFAGMIAALLLGCGSARNIPTYTKTSPVAAATSEESSASPDFTNQDVDSMVVEVETVADDTTSFNEAMASEPDETAFATSDMAAEIEASFAQNQNGKALGPIKTLVKNLAAAAKNGKKNRTKNIAVQLLKLIEKKANQGQAKAKDQKAKVAELVKKIVEAANKNKKDDLKKAVEDLIKLLTTKQ